MLAARGLVISAGKMSGLWSGQPNAVKLDDLDIICAVLGCQVGELLIPEPGRVAGPAGQPDGIVAAAASSAQPRVVPRRRDGRSLPPA
jgi:Cro/C1-type HTH DNA-binding domain